MSHAIRGLRNVGIYSLPVSLLAIAGALLLALFHYPAPAPSAAVETRLSTLSGSSDYWRNHADAMFAAMLADALRQLRAERDARARTLMYRPPHDPSSAELPALLRIAPPIGQSAAGGCPSRSGLIRL
jgi:hypothetical protein